jgi:hypothetical protein
MISTENWATILSWAVYSGRRWHVYWWNHRNRFDLLFLESEVCGIQLTGLISEPFGGDADNR